MRAHCLSHLSSFFGGCAARRGRGVPFVGGGRGSSLAPTEAGNSGRDVGLFISAPKGVK